MPIFRARRENVGKTLISKIFRFKLKTYNISQFEPRVITVKNAWHDAEQ